MRGRNDSAEYHYLLATMQEEEMAELCGEESPEERVLIRRPQQGRDEGEYKQCCHARRAGDCASSVSTVEYMTHSEVSQSVRAGSGGRQA